jgi:hypothetical protein
MNVIQHYKTRTNIPLPKRTTQNNKDPMAPIYKKVIYNNNRQFGADITNQINNNNLFIKKSTSVNNIKNNTSKNSSHSKEKNDKKAQLGSIISKAQIIKKESELGKSHTFYLNKSIKNTNKINNQDLM